MQFFQKKKDPKQIARESKRNIARSQRDIEREKAALERQEKQLIAEIKQAARKGNDASTKILAKQLVQLRAHKDKMTQMKSTIGMTSMHCTAMTAQMTMASAIETSTKAMSAAAKASNMDKFQHTLMEFEKQNAQLSIQEEMINDSLIDAFDDENAEEEEEQVMGQVLAEIGLELDGKMANAPDTKIAAPAPPAAVARQQPKQTDIASYLS